MRKIRTTSPNAENHSKLILKKNVFSCDCIFNCVLPSREHVGQVEACAGERGLPLDQRRSKIALCILTAHMLGRRKKVYMDPNQF